MSDLLKRFEIIQNAVALGDEELIASQAEKLPEDAAELRRLLQNNEYAAAAVWLAEFRKNNFAPAEYVSPETAALLLEIKHLENALTELAAAKSETEKSIAEFTAAYLEEVGPLLQELLQKQMEDAETAAENNKAAAKEAETARREYEEFRKRRDETPKLPRLTESEELDLKLLFRRAARLCHPDKLPEDKKEAGKKIFQELEEANRENDLERAREIWQKLESGDWTPSAEKQDDKTLRRRAAELRRKTEILRAEIAELQKDGTWQTIKSLAENKTPWAEFFAQTREDLRKKLRQISAD